MLKLVGAGSTFGGPNDDPGAGNDRDDWKEEGLSVITEEDLKLSHVKSLFLEKVPKGMTGLARRLNPERFYVAARWDYKVTPRTFLRDCLVTVTCKRTGRRANARPVDWGPAKWTGKAIDMSPGLMKFLGGVTGDQFEMLVPQPGESLPVKEDAYVPQKDPRDNYKNAPEDPPGEGVGIVGNLIAQLAVPLVISLVTGFAKKKLGGVVDKVLKTEKKLKGEPGPAKEDNAVKEILGPEKPKTQWGPIVEEITRAIIQGIVGAINEKYQSKDWEEAQKDGVEGVLSKLLS